MYGRIVPCIRRVENRADMDDRISNALVNKVIPAKENYTFSYMIELKIKSINKKFSK